MLGDLIGDHYGIWVKSFMAGSGVVDCLLVDVWAFRKGMVLADEISI